VTLNSQKAMPLTEKPILLEVKYLIHAISTYNHFKLGSAFSIKDSQ